MSAIEYPSTLPGPTNAPFFPTERRLLSSLPGPRQARPMQRDRGATQQVTFVFTDDELATFQTWLDTTLVRSGAWFTSDWPIPSGGTAVRRFVGEPSYPTYYANVGWQISAQCEVRGRGMDPRAYTDYIVTLVAPTNCGATDVVGVTLSGLDPTITYELSELGGGTYVAWSAFPNDAAASPLLPWHNRFIVTRVSDSFDVAFGSDSVGATPEAARALFPGGTITGDSAYIFWIEDNNPSDDRGGLTIQVRGG